MVTAAQFRNGRPCESATLPLNIWIASTRFQIQIATMNGRPMKMAANTMATIMPSNWISPVAVWPRYSRPMPQMPKNDGSNSSRPAADFDLSDCCTYPPG